MQTGFRYRSHKRSHSTADEDAHLFRQHSHHTPLLPFRQRIPSAITSTIPASPSPALSDLPPLLPNIPPLPQASPDLPGQTQLRYHRHQQHRQKLQQKLLQQQLLQHQIQQQQLLQQQQQAKVHRKGFQFLKNRILSQVGTLFSNPRTPNSSSKLYRHHDSSFDSEYNQMELSNVVVSHAIHQCTEDTDMQRIIRDLLAQGVSRSLQQSASTRMSPFTWFDLLLRSKFTNVRAPQQLTYTRTSCTCITCTLRTHQRRPNERRSSRTTSTRSIRSSSMDLLMLRKPSGLKPLKDAPPMPNFIQQLPLPTSDDLISLGGTPLRHKLQIGTLFRLNSRSGARLTIHPDIKPLFEHTAYTGPLSLDAVYCDVAAVAADYYQTNKGPKQRKLFLHGELIRLPVQMGVVKLGTHSLRMDEVASDYIMYRPQVVNVYKGQLVLEGNSAASFIPTGIRFYIGFGEEHASAPVYSDGSMGSPRQLGLNELLLHHHMVDILRVVVK